MTVKELTEFLEAVNPNAKVGVAVGAKGPNSVVQYYDKFAIAGFFNENDDESPSNYFSIRFMKLLDEDDVDELYHARFDDEEE